MHIRWEPYRAGSWRLKVDQATLAYMDPVEGGYYAVSSIDGRTVHCFGFNQAQETGEKMVLDFAHEQTYAFTTELKCLLAGRNVMEAMRKAQEAASD